MSGLFLPDHPDLRPLQADLRRLLYKFLRVLRDHAAPGLSTILGHLLRTATARRAGDQDADPATVLAGLDPDSEDQLVRALVLLLDLANLAEDRHRIRVLRQRAAAGQHDEGPAAAIAELVEAGIAGPRLARLVSGLEVEPVFTAHPTEAKRRTVRHTLGRLRDDLVALERVDLLPDERRRLHARLDHDLACLWETDTLHPRRPTPIEELHRSLFLADSLWRVVPEILADMRSALAGRCDLADNDIAGALRFGTWIGGDRDGNPNVTAGVSTAALRHLRAAALDRHLAECQELSHVLTMSRRRHPASPALDQRLASWRRRYPALDEELLDLHPDETCRQFLAAITWRLTRSRTSDLLEEPPAGAYADAGELADDVQVLAEALRRAGHSALMSERLQPWLDRIRVFGFHLARLDTREDSAAIVRAVCEVAAQLGLDEDYAAHDEAGRRRFLATPLDGPVVATLDPDALSEGARDLLRTVHLAYHAATTIGPAATGVFIVSMTHQPSDLLAVQWLDNLVARYHRAEGTPVHRNLVPLFETIDDLARAEGILDGLLTDPAYRRHLDLVGGRQVCMVGYSDSCKDGGYLRSNWELYRAQRRIAATCHRHGVEAVVFHGRGGALGRGGGPAARSILSLPPAAVDGRLRLTEQGEVLAERYDDPTIARRHLEQLLGATLLVSGRSERRPHSEWEERIERAATTAEAAWRELIANEAFLDLFAEATPLAVIESLAIASRPARRRERRPGLTDLRAIPFTFALTQSRLLLTAWYGLGSGLEAAGAAGDWRQLYHDWPFLRAVIDNAELALAKVDLDLAERYVDLAADPPAVRLLFQQIRVEYQRTVAVICATKHQDRLLAGIPWLESSIRLRNPVVDCLNLVQIGLEHRARSGRPEPGLDDRRRVCLQGIAAGLRTTG